MKPHGHYHPAFWFPFASFRFGGKGRLKQAKHDGLSFHAEVFDVFGKVVKIMVWESTQPSGCHQGEQRGFAFLGSALKSPADAFGGDKRGIAPSFAYRLGDMEDQQAPRCGVECETLFSFADSARGVQSREDVSKRRFDGRVGCKQSSQLFGKRTPSNRPGTDCGILCVVETRRQMPQSHLAGGVGIIIGTNSGEQRFQILSGSRRGEQRVWEQGCA